MQATLITRCPMIDGQSLKGLFSKAFNFNEYAANSIFNNSFELYSLLRMSSYELKNIP